MVLNRRSTTLLELIMAVMLLGIIALSLAAIDSFCRHHVLSAEKRVIGQNSASFALEHIIKHIGEAVGNAQVNGSVVAIDASPLTLRAYVDTNLNGLRDSSSTDMQVGYQYDSSSHTLRFCDDINASGNCQGGWNNAEVISNKVIGFTAVMPSPNLIDVSIVTCADPTGSPYACGTASNPNTEMQTYISLPSVSVN